MARIFNSVDQEVDETARLILMEKPDITFRDFGMKLRDELAPNAIEVTIAMMAQYWKKYRGWDGRTTATHNVETGGWR